MCITAYGVKNIFKSSKCPIDFCTELPRTLSGTLEHHCASQDLHEWWLFSFLPVWGNVCQAGSHGREHFRKKGDEGRCYDCFSLQKQTPSWALKPYKTLPQSPHMQCLYICLVQRCGYVYFTKGKKKWQVWWKEQSPPAVEHCLDKVIRHQKVQYK